MSKQKKQKAPASGKRRAPRGSRAVVTVTAAQGAVEVMVKERQDGRGSLFYAEYTHPTKGRRRQSLQTDDISLAKTRAQEIANELAVLLSHHPKADVSLQDLEDLRLGDLFAQFRAHRLPNFVKDGVPNGHWLNLDRTMRIAEAILGRNQVVSEIGQTEVDRFRRERAAGGFAIDGCVRPDQFDKILFPPDPRTMEACGPNAMAKEILLLSTIFNWGRRQTIPGGRGLTLLKRNPLHGISLSAGMVDAMRPFMTDSRHALMVQHAEASEIITLERYPDMPIGFQETLLITARGTARRIRGLLGLRHGDLLFMREQVRVKLLELGWPESWADAWPYGAIYWDPEFDKEGYSRLMPMSKRLHDRLLRYVHDRGVIDPHAWLFPSPNDPSRHASVGAAWLWFRRIEQKAQEAGEDLPRLLYGAWHSYRRQWRAERAGFFDNKLVALCGGWRRFKGWEEAMNQGYLAYNPRALYLCMEFDPARDAPRDGRLPGVKVVVHAPGRTSDGQPRILTSQGA